MKRVGKKQAVIIHLKKQWRNRMRWVAYKDIAHISVNMVHCFTGYQEAAIFCKRNNGNNNMPYKAAVITDLLKRLQISTNKLAGRQAISKAALCERYPALSFPFDTDELHPVPVDAYFPVTWNRVVNSLTDIEQWLVTKDGCPDTVLYKNVRYAKALEYFMKRCGGIDTNERNVLRLQVAIRDAPLGKLVEIYHFYYHPKRACYMLDQHIDASQPFLLPVNYFARYSSRLKRLEFFDGNLRKVPAGKIVEEMDAQYFDME